MKEWMNPQTIEQWLTQLSTWIRVEVLANETLIELCVILVAVSLVWSLGRPLKRGFSSITERHHRYRLVPAR